MTTNRRTLHRILAGLALGLLMSTTALAQGSNEPRIRIQMPETTTTPVDLHSFNSADLLRQGAEVTMENQTPVEVALVVGVMQDGKVLTQQQSDPFVLESGTYILSESEGDFVINEQDLRSGPIEPAVVRFDAPHLDLGMQQGTTGRLGDPRALHFEPYLADIPDPLKRFEGARWDAITEEVDIDPGTSAFMVMLVPTNDAGGQEVQTTPVVLPFTAGR